MVTSPSTLIIVAPTGAETEKADFPALPTTLDELMEISDAGEIMPPKSTWFEPKLRDGLLSHLI